MLLWKVFSCNCRNFEILFQIEKLVLPGSVDLKHDTAICVVVKGELQNYFESKSNHPVGTPLHHFFICFR
jgi:hypothetical protein